MANELSTIGVTLKYAVESTAGTMPTTFTTAIPNVTSIGGFPTNPDALDCTDLTDIWRRYIPGVKDAGGAITIGVNLTSAFKTAWEAAVTAAEGGVSSSKACWWEVDVPNFGKFHFAGMPSDIPLPDVGVNEVFAGEVSVMPNQIAGWAAA